MRIEPALPEDLAAVAALGRDAGLAAIDAAQLVHPAARLWVARTGEGVVVGFLLLWEVADEIEIHDLAVVPAWRRRGIGRSLVNEAQCYAHERGTRLMALEVRSGNQAALALYANLGFSPVHRRKAYYADGEDAIVMHHELGPSTTDSIDPAAPSRARPHPEFQRLSSCHASPGSRLAFKVAALLRRESIGNAYHVLTFDVPEGLPATPGQFVMVRGSTWSDAPLLPRPMSLLSGGTEAAILIKVVGDGSTRMARAEPGERFSLLAPLGKGWTTPDPARKPILVAGGVGVAPLLFLARRLQAAKVRPTVAYGGRSASDLPLDDELAEVSDLHIATEDGSRGLRGRVTDLLEKLLHPEAELFTCGPDRMMAAVAALSRARGVPCQASLETRMACGYGVCLGCAVPVLDGDYLYACTEGPCVDAHRIDWNRGLEPASTSRSEHRAP